MGKVWCPLRYPHGSGSVSAAVMRVMKGGQKKIHWVLDCHRLKKLSVQPKYLGASLTNKFALMEMPPQLHVAEVQLLSKTVDKVYQAKIHQEIFHMMSPRVLKAADIHVQVPHDNRVPTREAVDCLFNIRNFINSGNKYVRSDEWGPLCTQSNFAAHHALSLETHLYDGPSLWTVPHDQAHSPLCSLV